ncbi:MAG: glycosyltransferase [Flavitalea sp.]
MNLAPVVVFCYKRIDTLRKTIEALKENPEAAQTHLIVFSDGPKKEADHLSVAMVRDYIHHLDGFRMITTYFSETNKGLANSIIEGVTLVFQKYDRVIVLEDDLVTSNNFLSYMNQALDFYEFNNRIFSISGYTSIIKNGDASKVYFTKRASSWGWATWRKRWNFIDWEVKDYVDFYIDAKSRKEFNRMGSDLSGMLDKQMSGKINSWAIRWCYHQFKQDLYTVFPQVSKVRNIGFNPEGTHTIDHFNRFDTILDKSSSTNFEFTDEVMLDKNIFRQFYSKYSVITRIRYRLLNSFARI